MASTLNYDGGLTCALKVTDLKKSIRWYQEVLGFRLLFEHEEMQWCELATEVPGVSIGLLQLEKSEGKEGTTLMFGVRDIEAARKQLEGRNVRFEGPTQVIENVVKLATFYDDVGNTLMLYEDLQKR